jgi:hypothetical protein
MSLLIAIVIGATVAAVMAMQAVVLVVDSLTKHARQK